MNKKSSAVGCDIRIPMFLTPTFNELLKMDYFGYYPVKPYSTETYEALKEELKNNGIDYDLICG